jgi:hypothetical protein
VWVPLFNVLLLGFEVGEIKSPLEFIARYSGKYFTNSNRESCTELKIKGLLRLLLCTNPSFNAIV